MTGRKLKILLYYIPGSCQIAQSGRIRFVWRKTLVFYMVSAGQEGLCNRERGLLHEPSASIYSTYHSSAAGSTCSSKSLGASAGTTAQGRVLELCNTLTLWTFSFPHHSPKCHLRSFLYSWGSGYNKGWLKWEMLYTTGPLQVLRHWDSKMNRNAELDPLNSTYLSCIYAHKTILVWKFEWVVLLQCKNRSPLQKIKV